MNKLKLDQNQIDWLTNHNTLNEMNHMSLRQRALLIKSRYNLRTFSYVTLKNYYEKYGIKYKRPNY